MSEWKETTIGKEVNLLTGHPFKSAQYTDSEDDYLLLRGDNIGQGFISWENAKRWTKSKAEGLEDYFLEEGDVILAMDRPWIEAGLKFSYLSKDDLPCLLVQRVSCLRAKDSLNQTFLRYIIQGYKFTQYVIKTQTGTAVPHISGTQIKDFEFLMPSLAEQEKIAKALSCLDRKIENLRKQNETLEAIAQTLFKHWFIDFEFPNTDGKPYKSSGGAMEPSELGEIPAGWRVGKFDDFFDLFSGGTPKTSVPEYWDGDIKWLSGKDVTSHNKKIILNTEKQISEIGLTKSAAKLLPQYTTVISARGTVGNYCLLSESMTISQSNFGVLAQQKEHTFFGHFLIGNLIGKLKREAYGSVFDTITTSNFRRLKVLIPDAIALARFERITTNFLGKVLVNSEQIQTLSKTRDALLPKLMSGKLRIQED